MCVYIHTHQITHVYFMLLCTTGGITMFKALSWRSEGRCPVVGNSPASAGDVSSIPGLRRFHVPWGH